MAKILSGKVVSVLMQDTIIVEVSRKKPHPLYKKLLTKSKRFKVDTKGKTAGVGDIVKMRETRPLAKGKHFVLITGGEK